MLDTSEDIIGENIRTKAPSAELGPDQLDTCLLYTSPSPRDQNASRMPSSA